MTLVRRPFLLIGPLAVMVVVMAFATNVLPLRQIVSQRQEIAAAEARLAELVAANDRLDAHVSVLDSPVEIERIAREDLGYVRPGEEAYVVIDPTPEEPPTPGEANMDGQAVEAAPATESGWFGRLWDYVTGRDLASG